MFLIRLTMRNFRGFYGSHTLEFANGHDRPVTVIHGENGAGKTNLLNAIFWCLTGSFTPRLSNPEMLPNKAARDEDKGSECSVELTFEHEKRKYLARRIVVARGKADLELYLLDGAKQRPIANPQNTIDRIIPQGLSRWFFFDSEAVGELELSGSEEFRRSLRRVLGFELVDQLVDDLEVCLTKRQKVLAQASNSKELKEIQEAMDGVDHVLPNQKEKVRELGEKLQVVGTRIEKVDAALRNLPKSRPLQERRSRIEQQIKAKQLSRKETREQNAKFMGETVPAVLLFSRAVAFEGELHIKENAGKLPAPYSDQLVEDILNSGFCVCGRPVTEGSHEATKIQGLLRNASTTSFNSRVRNIQYLLKDIRIARDGYSESMNERTKRVTDIDVEIAELDEELKQIKDELGKIDEDAVKELESQRTEAQKEFRDLDQRLAVINNYISENERKKRDLKARYESAERRLGQGDAVKKEIDKIRRLSEYIGKTLQKQELRALNILQLVLNGVLDQYLTKHFHARVNPSTYEVEMLDAKGRQVGRSTGEGQVLKFAFITTVVALAGRKTQEKIDFLAEPTVAPLVLDAPFSALDPTYQGSVGENLAAQTSQLVLLLSLAGWGDAVAKALNPYVGRRYVLISCSTGPRGKKPIKEMTIGRKRVVLNEYDAERDESILMEY